MSDIKTLLEERGKTHGRYLDHATTTQGLKQHVSNMLTIVGKTLTATQQEALDMILHKIGRIVAGNANTTDHWQDIAGYATLIVNELEEVPDANDSGNA